MADKHVNHEETINKNHESSQIGTYISVGVVGGFIFLTYLLVYGLYMARV